MHSSSIRHNGEAIIFSAFSGTGKTTHTNLWREVFPNVEIINGDNGYCLAEDDGVYIYGAPWCGTSGECMNVKVPVKAVVFLEQAKENSIQKLSVPMAFMRLSTGCFLPAWDKELMTNSVVTTERMAASIDCYVLKCLPDHDAVRTAHYGIYGK